jgi:hypothetical protein
MSYCVLVVCVISFGLQAGGLILFGGNLVSLFISKSNRRGPTLTDLKVLYKALFVHYRSAMLKTTELTVKKAYS